MIQNEWVRGFCDGGVWMAKMWGVQLNLESWVDSERALGHDLSEEVIRARVAMQLADVFGINSVAKGDAEYGGDGR